MSRSYNETSPLLNPTARASETASRHSLRGDIQEKIDEAKVVIEDVVEDLEEKGKQMGKRVNSWFRDWSEFLATTGVASFGVGVVLGGIYSGLLSSFIEDIVLPPFEVLWGNYLGEFYVVLKPGRNGPPYDSLAEAQKDGAITENWGKFIHVLVNTIIITLVLAGLVGFFMRFQRAFSVKQSNFQTCTECTRPIPIRAKRCPFCTSYVRGKKKMQPAEKNTANEKAQADQDEAKVPNIS
ncbi:hypothetical protein M427DRAFT_133448 [Gonapodya prolifera JEL478]|uniref:Gated mechanosensitive channel n=1 Tax=Gonapodya prolifera (strain JEL478) TaxID=1344416 RepID=A0A139AKR4_GONPJ|nr:hypothetical protein M427DRAFT_133448 [Gonapodya prolifera JEL478]|eukprot:KXS17288.1 hypothetical protein M427DRAFT_133448 [Gonapodya prolifera JEL478]